MSVWIGAWIVLGIVYLILGLLTCTHAIDGYREKLIRGECSQIPMGLALAWLAICALIWPLLWACAFYQLALRALREITK